MYILVYPIPVFIIDCVLILCNKLYIVDFVSVEKCFGPNFCNRTTNLKIVLCEFYSKNKCEGHKNIEFCEVALFYLFSL